MSLTDDFYFGFMIISIRFYDLLVSSSIAETHKECGLMINGKCVYITMLIGNKLAQCK